MRLRQLRLQLPLQQALAHRIPVLGDQIVLIGLIDQTGLISPHIFGPSLTLKMVHRHLLH